MHQNIAAIYQWHCCSKLQQKRFYGLDPRMRLMLEKENFGAEIFDSMQVEVDMDELSLADVEYDDHLDVEEEGDEDEDEDEDDDEEDEEEEDEDYAFPIGPLPQNITNDLKSLDEMVSDSFVNGPFPASFSLSTYVISTVNSITCSADDWIRTADLL